MIQKVLNYLHVGWRTAHNLHTAHWIMTAFIALFPAAVTAALVGFVGEHSVFLLSVIFILCFGVTSLMVLALLGHPREAIDQWRSATGRKNAPSILATERAPNNTDLANCIFISGLMFISNILTNI
jgi:hypothetical protein